MACSFKRGELVKLKDGVSLQKFSQGTIYKIEAVIRVACSPTLHFKLPSGTQDAAPMHFEPLAAERPREDPAVQIVALSTVYEKFQDPETRNLKRKLEEVTRGMERARMEREDHRRRICILSSCLCEMVHERDELLDHIDGDQSTITEARNLLDMGQSSEARRVLNDALSDPESGTESDESDGREP